MHETAQEHVARRFHEAYERLAPDFGYRTREASSKPWAAVPAANRDLMVATVGALIADGVIIPAATFELARRAVRALVDAEVTGRSMDEALVFAAPVLGDERETPALSRSGERP